MQAFIAEIAVHEPRVLTGVPAVINTVLRSKAPEGEYPGEVFLVSHYSVRNGQIAFVGRDVESPKDAQQLLIVEVLTRNGGTPASVMSCLNEALQRSMNIPAMSFHVRIHTSLDLKRQDR